MTKIPTIFSAIILTSMIFLAACGGNGQTSNAANRKSPAATPVLTIDGVRLNIEIVQDAESRQQGLMNREQLAEDQGMLFVFESTRMLSFWMRNTYIPLDIAFIDEGGKIVDIQRMEPLDDTTSYHSAAPALYALEVNAGWFKERGIKVGSQVEF